MAESTIATFEKGDIVVKVIQHKSSTPVGDYDTVNYTYQCRATRAGRDIETESLTGEKIPKNYRGAIGYGRKVFKELKKRQEVA